MKEIPSLLSLSTPSRPTTACPWKAPTRGELFLVLRAIRDFIAGFRVLHFSGPCVTISHDR
jgi:hypothetical protein